MQNFNQNEIIGKITLWYKAHKRLMSACAILALAIVLLTLFRPNKQEVRLPVSPVAVVTDATRLAKNVNYQAEYDERFSRTVNGVYETHSYKLRESKKDANWKKETYINDLTLLEAFIRNGKIYSHCTTYPEVSCVEKEIDGTNDGASTRDAMLSGMNLWVEKNIFQASVYQQEIVVGSESRSATCVSYSFNPNFVTDEDVAALMASIGSSVTSTPGSAAALQEWMKQYDAEVCYDDKTGIVMNYHSVIRQSMPLQSGGQMDYESENTQTITRLRLNQLFSSEEFSTSSAR
jgi:hypothetical protein